MPCKTFNLSPKRRINSKKVLLRIFVYSIIYENQNFEFKFPETKKRISPFFTVHVENEKSNRSIFYRPSRDIDLSIRVFFFLCQLFSCRIPEDDARACCWLRCSTFRKLCWKCFAFFSVRPWNEKFATVTLHCVTRAFCGKQFSSLLMMMSWLSAALKSTENLNLNIGWIEDKEDKCRWWGKRWIN